MNYIFKFCLTLNSLLFSLVVFLVNQGIVLNVLGHSLSGITNYVSYSLYVSMIFIINFFSLWLTRFLGNDTLPFEDVESVEPANDAFLPSYLGYFFVALSVDSIQMYLFVFGIISIFIFFSRISYFNPLLFLHGYNFYYVVSSEGVKTLIISKKKIKGKSNANFEYLKRVNNYTFIDTEA